MFSFLPLINDPVSIGLSFLLLHIPAIILSKAINDLVVFSNVPQFFYKFYPNDSSVFCCSLGQPL